MQVTAFGRTFGRPPSPEKVAQAEAAKVEKEKKRRERQLHPTKWTLFWRRAFETMGTLGLAIAVAAICALVFGGCFHFMVIKSCGLQNATYLSFFAAAIAAYGGAGLTLVLRT